jgi:hypothetical protein
MQPPNPATPALALLLQDREGMSTALKRFIEAGERRLAELEEPERTIVAAKLHNEILRRFPDGIDANPDLEFDGNYLFGKPLSDKDVEDKIIEELDYRQDNKSASDMAEDGCYDDAWEEESDRGGYRFRPIPIDQELKRAASTMLLAGGTEAEAGTQIIEEAPDQASMGALVADPTIHDAPDAVSLGQIYEQEMGEKMGFAQCKRPYFTRVAKLIFRAGQAWKRVGNIKKTCEFCGREFLGTKNARYCNMCRSPQMCAIRRRTKVEDLT